MTDDRLPPAEFIAKTGDGDFLRSVIEGMLQVIMAADVDGLIGVCRHERSDGRKTGRNGYRDRSLDKRLGTLDCFPGFLEQRKTVEKALASVIQEAWIAGVRTCRVDDLVQAMGMSGISKSSVSNMDRRGKKPLIPLVWAVRLGGVSGGEIGMLVLARVLSTGLEELNGWREAKCRRWAEMAKVPAMHSIAGKPSEGELHQHPA